MSASDDDQGADDRKERYRRAIAFLQRARELPELTPSQIDRIEGRLYQARPRARRAVLLPALAVLAIVLLAGAALATAGRSLTAVPVLGALVHRLWGPAPGDGGGGHARGNPTNDVAGRLLAPSALTPVRRSDPLADPAPAAVIDSPPSAPVGLVNHSAAGAGAADAEEATHAPARDQRRRPETRVALAAHPVGFDVERSDAVAPPAAAAASAITGTPRADQDDSARRTLPPAAVAPHLAPAPPPVREGQPASEPLAARTPPAPQATGTVPAPSEATAPVPVESAIVAESRSFASALALWHRDHDAQAALAALDAHERGFPSGEIRLEAQLLRAEILLAGGHAREGLALLDRLALTGLPRARELRTVRGELRVKLGRCADGRADLEAVLAGGEADPLGQRARRALAVCP